MPIRYQNGGTRCQPYHHICVSIGVWCQTYHPPQDFYFQLSLFISFYLSLSLFLTISLSFSLHLSLILSISCPHDFGNPVILLYLVALPLEVYNFELILRTNSFIIWITSSGVATPNLWICFKMFFQLFFNLGDVGVLQLEHNDIFSVEKYIYFFKEFYMRCCLSVKQST